MISFEPWVATCIVPCKTSVLKTNLSKERKKMVITVKQIKFKELKEFKEFKEFKGLNLKNLNPLPKISSNFAPAKISEH